MTKFRTCVAIAALMIAMPAMAGTRSECAELRAFNDRQPSQADTTLLPCRCIPVSERADKVYPTTGVRPAEDAYSPRRLSIRDPEWRAAQKKASRRAACADDG
jgi:hypothetical protein